MGVNYNGVIFEDILHFLFHYLSLTMVGSDAQATTISSLVQIVFSHTKLVTFQEMRINALHLFISCFRLQYFRIWNLTDSLSAFYHEPDVCWPKCECNFAVKNPNPLMLSFLHLSLLWEVFFCYYNILCHSAGVSGEEAGRMSQTVPHWCRQNRGLTSVFALWVSTQSFPSCHTQK